MRGQDTSGNNDGDATKHVTSQWLPVIKAGICSRAQPELVVMGILFQSDKNAYCAWGSPMISRDSSELPRESPLVYQDEGHEVELN